jgi:hypothetical protein
MLDSLKPPAAVSALDPRHVNLVDMSCCRKFWRKIRKEVVVDVEAAQLAAMPES